MFQLASRDARMVTIRIGDGDTRPSTGCLLPAAFWSSWQAASPRAPTGPPAQAELH